MATINNNTNTFTTGKGLSLILKDTKGDDFKIIYDYAKWEIEPNNNKEREKTITRIDLIDLSKDGEWESQRKIYDTEKEVKKISSDVQFKVRLSMMLEAPQYFGIKNNEKMVEDTMALYLLHRKELKEEEKFNKFLLLDLD